MAEIRQRFRTRGGACWHRGINLIERIEAARKRAPNAEGISFDPQVASSRLARWRAEPAYRDEAAFPARLAMDGVSIEEFARILGESVNTAGTAAGPQPWWSSIVEDAFAGAPAQFLEADIPESMGAVGHARMLVMIRPLIDWARNTLREALARMLEREPNPCGDATFLESLWYPSLPAVLLAIISRTLVLEMHVARLKGQLKGATSGERFESFIDRLRRRSVADKLLREYPVLARQVVVCLHNWQSAGARFAQDLLDDWDAIRNQWPSVEDAGTLAAIGGNAGDAHRGGRSVLLLTFSSGFKLVYKPRSLAVDADFQDLLAWAGEHGGGHPFRRLELLNVGDHGWVEFVTRDTQLTEEQAQRYFWRHGAFLALLYALEATDFHYENFIVAGEHPVLVDLEAMFQPRLQDASRSGAGEVAGREMNYSVLRVGLLPQSMFAGPDRLGLDVSGLGAAAGQTTPFDLPMWRNAGTDDMHLTREKGNFSGSPNRPIVDGAPVNALRYADVIVEGFSHTYRLLAAHRAELLGDKGMLARFAGDEVRVLLRATRTYTRLHQESFHPDVLRDALDRDRLFDMLWSTAAHVPKLPRVIAAERRALWNLDIPLFSTRPDSCDIFSDDGEIIPDFLAEPSLAVVRRQIERMCDSDLVRQTWFIRAALATLELDLEAPVRAPSGPAPWWPAAKAHDALSMSEAIGDRLAELAIRGEHDASWIGLALVNSRAFDLAPLGLDLYDGLPGVTLYLAYLGAISGQQRHTELAQAAMNSVLSESRRARDWEKCIGGFGGWGGVIHVCTHLAALWGRTDLLDEAEDIVALLPDLIAADDYLDIIGGAAGCIPPLLNLHRLTGSATALAAARRCGQRLAETARPQDVGCGWFGNVPSEKPLGGFSHGASGIAWALFGLADACGEARFGDLARAAIAYDRSLFSVEAGNWEDIRAVGRRSSDGKERPKGFQVAWCHGAPGIGLARLLSLRHQDDAASRAEIDAALATTVARGFGASHCLCHGDMGNIDLLLHAGQTLPDERWKRERDRCATLILERLGNTGPLCANPGGIESPGLMTGLAGIGYGLLRLAAPSRVPSVVVLAPPLVA